LERIQIEQENGENDEKFDSRVGSGIGANLRELSSQNNDAIREKRLF
jgi:hypothetical protein